MSPAQRNVERLRAFLTEITYRKGAYSPDPLTHAGNVIENSANLAQAALDGFDLEDVL